MNEEKCSKMRDEPYNEVHFYLTLFSICVIRQMEFLFRHYFEIREKLCSQMLFPIWKGR